MRIKQTIINTIVRRLTWLALAAVLAWLGIGHADAAFNMTNGYKACNTKGWYACYENTSGTPSNSTASGGFCNGFSYSFRSPLAGGGYLYMQGTKSCTDKCPANSTKIGNISVNPNDLACNPNPGYSAIKDANGNWTVVPSDQITCPTGQTYNPDTSSCEFPPPAALTDIEKAKECAKLENGSFHWKGLGCATLVDHVNGTPVYLAEPIAIVAKKCEQAVCPAWGDEPNTAATIDFGQSNYGRSKDGFCPHSVSNTGVLGRDGNDPDCAGYPDINFDGNTTYSVTFEDPPQETTVKSDTASNTVNMNTKTAENGNTRSDNLTFGPPNSSGSRPVIGTSRDYYPGTGSSMGSTPITPVNNVGGGGGGSGGEGEGGTCEDCAKEDTLQDVLDAVTDTPGETQPTFEDPPQSSDILAEMEQPKLDGLEGVQFTKTATCPTYSFSIPYFSDRVYTFDAHCTIIAGKEETVRFFAGMAWLMIAIVMVLGA